MSISKSSSTSMNIVRDTLLILLQGTGVYIAKRTPNATDKKFYNLGITTCCDIISSNKEMDFNTLIDRMLESKIRGELIKQSWLYPSTPRNHFHLAHDHSIDALRSLVLRFVTGVSSDSTTVNREADIREDVAY